MLLVSAASAETRRHVLGGRSMSQGFAPRAVTSEDGSEDARAMVNRIIAVIGIPMTSFNVRASLDVANATATTENNGRDRLILYNPEWMKAFKASVATDWSDWVVLAHEVGHHVAFHMDPSFPNHEAELQADYFAGFILNKLNAPLADVQLAMAMVSTDQASETHPGKSDRVAQIRNGWQAAARNVGANVIPAAMRVPSAAPIAPAPATPGPKEEQRVALLIGNTHYTTWGQPLKNPKNDVIAVGRELRKLGFSTTVVYDGTAKQMATAIADFKTESSEADWAIIYYAGTGIEVDGANYMIPVDADGRRALTFTSDHPDMRLDTAFSAVKGARRLRLVVADACRVDPAVVLGNPPKTGGAQALKVTEPPRGIVVAYSTGAGQYAGDGTGDLSPFAMSFVEALREAGIELPMVFRRVAAKVDEATGGSQVPTVLGNWPAEALYLSRR
jgi:hypothetical protein